MEGKNLPLCTARARDTRSRLRAIMHKLKHFSLLNETQLQT